MAVRIRIATKILMLAVSLLLLTVALSFFSSLQTHQLREDTQRISTLYIPVTELMDDLHVNGLKRLLAFEHWLGLLTAARPLPRAIETATADYNNWDRLIQTDVASTRKLLNIGPPGTPDAGEISRIHGLLDEIERETKMIAGVQHRILENVSNHALSDQLLQMHDMFQKELEERRNEMKKRIQSLTAAANETAGKRELGLVRVSIGATAFAVLFGLVFAWLVARRMVHPVEVLMTGVRSVEKGDLTIQIPVGSTDEIGVLTGSFNKLVEELRSKEKLKETFGKYIDPRIVEKVILNPGVAETEGGKRVMTVSFCDLVGFTGMSEDLTPTGLVRLLNRHFALVADAIHAYQGVLDKFIGDAVMAFWGPPFSTSGDHATQACRAALAQIRVMETLRLELPELTGLRKNIPVMDLRIGVASGDVVVGNIGADQARTYTVIGDTVNLASRLESVNRVYGTHILINEETRRLAADSIEVREIDWIAVKGKTEPATAFELLGPAGEIVKERLEARDRYEEALAAYRKFDWKTAETGFRGALEILPADGPSQVMLARIAELKAAPPTREWDGVWQLAEK
jgi:adenylate cyclase